MGALCAPLIAASKPQSSHQLRANSSNLNLRESPSQGNWACAQRPCASSTCRARSREKQKSKPSRHRSLRRPAIPGYVDLGNTFAEYITITITITTSGSTRYLVGTYHRDCYTETTCCGEFSMGMRKRLAAATHEPDPQSRSATRHRW